MYKLLITLNFALLTSCFSTPTDGPQEGIELNKIWSFDHGTAGGAPPVVHEGVVIMSGGLFIYALNEETGEEIWKSQFEEDNVLQGRIFLINGKQVAVAHTDKIRAWNISNGTLYWEFEYLNNGIEPRLTGKHISFNAKYGFTSEKSRFFILNNVGNVEKIKMLDNGYGVQGLCYYDGNLYIGQAKTIHGGLSLGRITTLNANTGDSLWAYNTENSGFVYSAPIVENEVVYAGAAGNSPRNVFAALDAETGEVKWEFLSDDPLKWTQSFTIGPKYIFASGSGKLFALDKETGGLVWDYRWESSTLVKPVYLGGYVYQSNHGSLFILDAETGKLVHEEPAPEGGGYIWHLAISEDKLFLQSSNKLIAYQPWHLRDN